MKKQIITGFIIVLAIIFSGCAGSYTPVKNMAKLDAKFADSAWDGKKIPMNQVCFTDTGSTPPLTISNIPQGTNAILMEVNDENYSPLSSGGGHGIVGFWIDKGSSTVTLPAVLGHTTENLPKDTFIESASRSKGRYATRGYLPPCSGGNNHMYSANIKAVYKAKNDKEESKLLGDTHIKFGKY
jgi:hypothetical protein